MIDSKVIEYKKAYVELIEILKRFPKEILEKIPSSVIDNLESQKDTSYEWMYDDSKEFENQEIKVETKALFVRLYREYIMDSSEKEKWDKYDIISKGIIEEEKAKKYDPLKIFESSNIQSSIDSNISEEINTKQELMVVENESFVSRITKLFKEFILKIFKKSE